MLPIFNKTLLKKKIKKNPFLFNMTVTSMVSLSLVLHCFSLILSEGWGYGNLDKFLRLSEDGSKLFP